MQLHLCVASLFLLYALAMDHDDHGGADDDNDDQGNEGAHGTPLPRRHNSYTAAARLQHVLGYEDAIFLEQITDVAACARRYRLSVTTLRRWIANRDTLIEQVHTQHHGHRRRIRTDHDGCWPEVEDSVHRWFIDFRRRALPISRMDLTDRAQQTFQNWWDELPQARRDELRLRRPERCQFVASNGWMDNFMRRKKIVQRRKTRDTASLPADANDRVHQFQMNVRDTVRKNGVTALYNMNETFVHLNFPPMYTAATRGDRNVEVRTSRGNPKLGCTIGLTIGSNGEKLPSHVVFREPGFIREIQGLQNVPENIRITSSRTGWENRDTLQHWLNEVFLPFLGEIQPNERLVLLDQYRPHMAEEFCNPIVEAGVLIDNIPARCTSLAQPLDLTIMRSFKSVLRSHWKNWKQANTDENGVCPRISLAEVLNLVSRAWADVPQESAARAFQVAGLTPDENGVFREIAHVNDLLEVADDDGDDGIQFDDYENSEPEDLA